MTFPRYILRTLCRLYQKILAVCTVLVQYWLAGSKKWKFEFMEIYNFANLFFLVPRLIICLYFWFLMTGSALNLALKLVVLHVELENVKHGVLRDALVEVSETQILFHWIGLKSWTINLWISTLFVHYIDTMRQK